MPNQLIGLTKLRQAVDNYLKTYDVRSLAEISHYLSHHSYGLRPDASCSIGEWIMRMSEVVPRDLLCLLSMRHSPGTESDFDAVRFVKTLEVLQEYFASTGLRHEPYKIWKIPTRTLFPASLMFAQTAPRGRRLSLMDIPLGQLGLSRVTRFDLSQQITKTLIQGFAPGRSVADKLRTVWQVGTDYNQEHPSHRLTDGPNTLLADHLLRASEPTQLPAFGLLTCWIDPAVPPWPEYVRLPREFAEQLLQVVRSAPNGADAGIAVLRLWWDFMNEVHGRKLTLRDFKQVHRNNTAVAYFQRSNLGWLTGASELNEREFERVRQAAVAYLEAVLETFEELPHVMPAKKEVQDGNS